MTMPITDPEQIEWHVDQMDEKALHDYLQGRFPDWNIQDI